MLLGSKRRVFESVCLEHRVGHLVSVRYLGGNCLGNGVTAGTPCLEAVNMNYLYTVLISFVVLGN